MVIVVMLSTSQSLSAQTLTFSLGNVSGQPGDTVTLPIYAENFTSINAYQGTIRFDSAYVDYYQYTNPIGVPPTFLINVLGSPGQGSIPLDAITFLWTDFFGGTQTVADSSIILELDFIIKSSAPNGISPVSIDGSVTTLGYSDNPSGSSLLAPVINNGTITVSSCVPTADPGFSFPAGVCGSATNPVATITGDIGGTFSVDNGATINAATGELLLSSVTIGSTYQITYTVGANCPAFSVQTVVILPPDDAGFTFLDTVCLNGADPVASVTGLSGGTFTVDNGATISTTTGLLDLTTVSAGQSYTITYSTNGFCPTSSSQSVFIRAADDASFTIPATVCISGVNPIPVITGLGGGSFAIDNGGAIDPVSGELDLLSTSAGIYQISYTTAGPCPVTSSQSVTVLPPDDASFLYPTASCPGGPNPIATITGVTGGQFTVSPSGTINPQTGELTMSSLVIGTTYTITYTTAGPCPDSSVNSFLLEDTQPPIIPTLPTITAECEVILSAPTAVDDCAGTITGTTTDSTQYQDLGTYQVMWIFDDGNGNIDSAAQIIMVVDTTAPVAGCQDITVPLDLQGNATITPLQVNNGSVDACAILSLSLDKNAFTTADLGANTVTLTVNDFGGNADACSAIVTVVDTAAPTAVCQDATIFLDSSGLAILDPSLIDGGSTVGQGSPILTVSQDSFTCADFGMNPVQLFVTDSTGAQDSCAAMVTVSDTIAPIVQCVEELILELDSTGIAVITAADLDSGSTDNCGMISFSISQDTFSIADTGMVQVMLTATDQSENASSCMTTVTIKTMSTSLFSPGSDPLYSLKLAPNPAADAVEIRWDSPRSGKINVQIIDGLGKMVFESDILKSGQVYTDQMDLRRLTDGVYFIKVQQGAEIRYERLLKMK